MGVKSFCPCLSVLLEAHITNHTGYVHVYNIRYELLGYDKREMNYRLTRIVKHLALIKITVTVDMLDVA